MSRRAALKALGGVGAAAIGAGGTYGFVYGRHALEVTRATIPVSNLPEALVDVRIGLITDIHRSIWMSHEDVTHAVSALMNERPDVVVLGGDYVTKSDHHYMQPSAEALDPLSAPYGVFGILGNHDDDHEMPNALASRGVQMLKDARTAVTIKGQLVEFIGLRFWTRRMSDIAALCRGLTGFPIMLAHDPRRLTEAAALKLPLVLSGHTHGGQVVLPGVGAIAAQKFPVPAGVGRRGQTTLFVSKGIGTVYVPVRINCPPEVAVLTLVREG